MNIYITRQKSEEWGTPGDLVASNWAGAGFHCKTLELPWHNNRHDISCICTGAYQAWTWYSQHLNCKVLRLEDKNGRTDCLIHPGNFGGDVAAGWVTDINGCTLVGAGYNFLENQDDKQQMAIIRSRATLLQLIAFVGNEKPVVHYQWAPGCDPTV